MGLKGTKKNGAPGELLPLILGGALSLSLPTWRRMALRCSMHAACFASDSRLSLSDSVALYLARGADMSR